jgi:hypothetical protein
VHCTTDDSCYYICNYCIVQGPPAREIQKLLVLGGTPLVNDVWLLDDVTQGLDGEWVTEWILVSHFSVYIYIYIHCTDCHTMHRVYTLLRTRSSPIKASYSYHC